MQARRDHPSAFAQAWKQVPTLCSASKFWTDYTDFSPAKKEAGASVRASNPLWQFFQNHKTGPGIWKWEHYFEIYHRHLSRFVGQSPAVLEVGIYSGGSLEMWHSYFGEKSHIYGVDIESACKAYESGHISVFIGDQADRKFWADCRRRIDRIDVFIDDGGHTVEQQRVTMEEMLPSLRAGGVYLCEDIHGESNGFAAFAASLVNGLNQVEILADSPVLRSGVSQFQKSIHSIHFYPFVMVIEKHSTPVASLSAPKHGTQWQPFL